MKNIEGRTKKQWEKKAVDILEITNIWWTWNKRDVVSKKLKREREKNMVVYTILMYYIMYKHKLPTF